MSQKYTSFRYQIPSDVFETLPGALLYFYEAGTSNLLPVYSTEALSTQLSNPVEADSSGLFPDIFLAPDIYDITAKDENLVTLWTSEDFEVSTIPVLNSNYFSLIGGEYYPAIAANVQTGTTYTVLNADRASLLSFTNNSGGTITLPAPSGSNFPNKWYCYISNNGSGTFTVTSASNINGLANYTLNSGTWGLFVSTGSTYVGSASQNFNQIFTKPGEPLTIASGAITIGNYSQYLVDTEGGIASDDLDTISGGIDGAELVLQMVDGGHNIVIKHDTGNIFNPSYQDLTLDNIQDNVLLRYDGGIMKWIVQAFSLNELVTGPVQINSGSRSAQGQLPAAWCTFNGTGSDPITIVDGYNVTNVTKTATGRFTINFTTALPSANYAVIGSCSNGTDAATNPEAFGVSTKGTSTLVINTVDNITNALVDCAITDLVVFCKLT